MNKRNLVRAVVLSVAALSCCGTTFALQFNPTNATNISADGSVNVGEWSQADYQSDGPSLAGSVYAQWSNDYQAGSKKYGGKFQYLLHNIEQLKTDEDYDYNVFDIGSRLTVWVFDDVDSVIDTTWLANAGLGSKYTSLVDTGFLVYNSVSGEYRKYDLGDVRPEDGGYDWDKYWGVYAAGGYNNSAFVNGLNNSLNDNNELYEVIYRADGYLDQIRRSVKDPDDTGRLVTYFEGDVKMVPEPTALPVLLLGLVAVIRRRHLTIKRREVAP